jgi:hypothetical protein
VTTAQRHPGNATDGTKARRPGRQPIGNARGKERHDPETPRGAAARGRVLRMMASLRHPVTGGEILAYTLTSWPAAGIRALMQRVADDGLVTVTGPGNAIGRRTRSYQLAGNAPEGGAR